MNFIDILIYLAKENSSYFVENYTDILALIGGICGSMIAFVYPQIFEAKERIKNISTILYERLSGNFFVKYYFISHVIFLIITIFSFFKENKYLLILNIVLVVISLIVSYVIYEHLLKKYLFNQKQHLKCLNKISFKNSNEKAIFDNLNVVQDLMLEIIYNKKISNEYLFFLKYLKLYLFKYVKFLVKHGKNSKEILNGNNKYLNRPLEIMVYLNQEIIRSESGYELHMQLINNYFKVLKVCCTDYYYNNLWIYNNNIIIEYFVQIINYSIKNNYGNSFNYVIYNFFILLNNFYYHKDNGNIELLELTFGIIKNIIDSNLNNKGTILISFSDELKNFYFCKDKVGSLDFLVDNIINLNCLVLAYLYFKKDYFLFKKYLTDYNQTNSIVISSKIFITNMKEIIKYSADKNCKIFKSGEKFNSYMYTTECKYHVLFFFFSGIYLCLQNCMKNIKSCIRNGHPEYIGNLGREIIGLLNINYINQLNSEDLFYNIYINTNSEEVIEKYLNNFFGNKEFLDIMELSNYVDGIKKFINQQIERIRKKIKEKQKQLITNDINSNTSQNVRDNCIKILQEYVKFQDYDKIKVEDTKEINNNFFYISFEKYYVLTGDYNNSLCVKEESYYRIYNDIFNRCKEISNINELQSVDLKNYFIINNFSNCVKYFKNAFPENKYVEKLNDYKTIGNIEINSINIPIYNITDFHMNSNHSVLIVKKDSLKLFKLDENVFKDNVSFEESDITKNEQLEYCYRKDYRSGKKITIKLPRFIFAEFYEDAVGYKIVVKE